MYEPCSFSCDSLGAGVGGGVSAKTPNGASKANESKKFAKIFICDFPCLSRESNPVWTGNQDA